MTKHTAASAAGLTGLVRDVLHHLYDVAYMQTHPLAQALAAVSGESPTLRGKLLFRALLEAIESLQPGTGVPADSRAWRSYRLLELRYVEGLSYDEVLTALAISKSQYQRDHALAIAAVANYLQDRWQLGPPFPALVEEAESRETLAVAEARELIGQMNLEEIDLARMLEELLALVRPAAGEGRLQLALRTASDVPTIRGDRVALRHAFLHLLNHALDEPIARSVAISVRGTGSAVEVTLDVAMASGTTTGPLHGPVDSATEVIRCLVESTGGVLEVRPLDPRGGWRATITIPLANRPVVLVVDNHPHFIGLVARYLAGQAWEVVGAQDVHRALELALEVRPRVILLDVMLPGQDGWDLFLSLRARPETRQTPVVICSVLYEPQVAKALGAVSYLAKPVSQAQLLETLAPWRLG